MKNLKIFLYEILHFIQDYNRTNLPIYICRLVSCFLISNSILPIIEHKYAIIISIIAVILTKLSTSIRGNSRIRNRPEQVTFVNLIINFNLRCNRTMVENTVTSCTLVPIATTVQVCPTLFVPRRAVVGIREAVFTVRFP